jgi:acetylornithine deacetylase/succinyl-diaminopimelate desuccinylase-like protein
MRLAQLLASMKNDEGRVLIEGFYDGVAPLGKAEQQAIHNAPAYDSELLREFGLAQPDGGGESLLQLIAQPSLNIDGFTSGWNGEQSKTIIPDQATASLDMRLVKNIQPGQQVAHLIAHIRKQGYVVLDREPTEQERVRFPRIARVDQEKGYPATETPMDLPVSQALMRIVDTAAGEPAVKLPISGGSLPMYIFENLKLPVIVVPMVNFDDNQHSPNENVRIGKR